jgi:uncharacterized protein YbbC (DUF1343 family)/CubicO group peptidase (beta-lactamase class C family)
MTWLRLFTRMCMNCQPKDVRNKMDRCASTRFWGRKHNVVFLAAILWVLAAIVLTTESHSADAHHWSAQAKSHSFEADQRSAPFSPLDEARLSRIDDIVKEAIERKKLPGAVVLVGLGGHIYYKKAMGNRALFPSIEPMTVDTVFDIASLTKVVVTTPSIMLLIEQGRVRLKDRVSYYVPNFGRHNKSKITVRHLLTHMSGLRADVDLSKSWKGYDRAIALAVEEVPLAKPGVRFIYSDINFFLLGDIVKRVSGMPLDEFAQANFFEPLDMRDTMFNPPGLLRSRIAPTGIYRGPGKTVFRGRVHDPTAGRMGGVAGHAGLFTSADDLANFCRMLVSGGSFDGKRVLSPLTIRKMISPSTPPKERNVRGLGWDLDSKYSANRGDLFPPGSFGHTGFTGTSLWLDPRSGLYVVFLSNRVHPDGKGNVISLRGKVSTIAASALTVQPSSSYQFMKNTPAKPRTPEPDLIKSQKRRSPVLTGIDVLQAEAFARLRGRRLGLLTNQTGRSREGVRTVDLLHRAENVELVKLFSPEHGITGVLEEGVRSSTDRKTGLNIQSLYGDHRRPTSKMLQGIDTMVVDLQDIGARFYTYMTSMAYVMEAAAKQKVGVLVLDRPNPINGYQIEGPTLAPSLLGFTGYFPMPIRHGMTMGELARLFKGENLIGVDLQVVKLKGWQRRDWFDDTGLLWVNPSPNMRNLIQATLYPGIGAIEGTNISVGRGTDTPFEQIGAPWIDGIKLSAELNRRALKGVRFYPVSFRPVSGKYAGKDCRGVFILVTDRAAIRPVRMGLEIATILYRLYPDEYDLEEAEKLFASKKSVTPIRAGEDPARVADRWKDDEAKWLGLRKTYLLY